MNCTPLLRAALVALLGAGLLATAQEPPRRDRKNGPRNDGDRPRVEVKMPAPAFRTEVPTHPWSIVLGRPTATGITLSILCHDDREGHLAYGPDPAAPERTTAPQRFPKGRPVELVLEGLNPDTRHHYRFHSRRLDGTAPEVTPVHSFSTARPPGRSFVFTVQADPHLDYGSDPAVYVKSLGQALASGTDFHVDLGDTFMTDKYPTFHDAAPQYLAQRYYFGTIGHSAPVFLVLGNHDGEQPARGGSGPGSMALWSNTQRKTYFPNPIPDTFYSGNTQADPSAGLLQNYYAWTWSDALFVALDPFWYSTRTGGRAGDNWGRTLGRVQYDWLRGTLARSRSPFVFVFLHHLVGGETPEGRGGAEASHFFEWGGRELDGRDTFATRRPGWPAPIHDLLVRHGAATVVFHGHDHLYARQERDGIVYLLVPQPGHQRFDNTRSAADYGYRSGVIQGASGIVRTRVTPTAATLEYVRAYPDAAESATRRTGQVTDRHVLPARTR